MVTMRRLPEDLRMGNSFGSLLEVGGIGTVDQRVDASEAAGAERPDERQRAKSAPRPEPTADDSSVQPKHLDGP